MDDFLEGRGGETEEEEKSEFSSPFLPQVLECKEVVVAVLVAAETKFDFAKCVSSEFSLRWVANP